MSKTTKRSHKSDEAEEVGGGFLSGLTNLIEKLGELAEKGKELQGLKEFGKDEMKGVYGFTIRTNLRGSESGSGVKVEPFGNVRTDEKTGRATVHEVIEPSRRHLRGAEPHHGDRRAAGNWTGGSCDRGPR